MHVNEVHDIDIHDSLCHFLAISPIIIEWGQFVKNMFWHVECHIIML